ncbi:uncharacterized protein LOC132758648 [Ruditapes philippinarum]|uniref:uncharacterized protein LOC132758648 n=1 Tax=Ruditapes philippinarum TaxID=129788 RepID=UPI00295AA597|nr:uncharacterized protein LOC132758648 [Ruditapes philippinarum]XP_060606321.1 uncharacterized protein LOC132758648 [Ruditapes philippinarum]
MTVLHTSMLTALVACIAALSFPCCEAFVFSDDCPAPAPCSCSGLADNALIMCSNKQLTSVPVFHSSNLHTKDIIVFLNSNNLTAIRNYVFRSLSSMHATSIHMQLDTNAIFFIEQHAFDGIENSLTILQLQNNKLTSVPNAVGRLRNLDYLDVTNNPLKYLGISSLSGIGLSLKTLYIDMTPFAVWPTELVSLTSLQHLTISSIPFESMNSSDFRGFDNSLITLDIKEAPRLRNIPCALTNLPRLTSFYLEHSGRLGANGTSAIAVNCSRPSHSITTFTLENSNLTTFPDVLHNFPRTTSLNLLGNSLEFIEIEKISSANRLAKVDLASNNFRRIPSALNRMINLTELDLSKNLIISVEDVDLSGLSKLQTLSLADNPIRYISTHAFDNNKLLAELNLANTNLRMIPVSVTSLTHLADFDLTGVTITCSCDMAYLKNWNIKPITSLDGVCTNTNAALKNFLSTSLPLCH